MRRFVLLAFLLCLILLITACTDSNPASEIPTGTYISNSGAGTDELKLAGSDYIVVTQGASVIEGGYATSSEEIAFLTAPQSAMCPATLGQAVYQWSFSDNLLTLTVEEDTCAYRAALFEQTWLKR